MKKILILMGYKTLNYGSNLQSIATCEMLRQIGMEVEVLNLDALWGMFRKNKVKFYLSSGDLSFIVKSKGGMYLSKFIEKIYPDYKKGIARRKELLYTFLDKRINYSNKVKNFAEATELSQNYDCVLLGSDQVWLPSSVMTDTYTLNFVDKNVKKIAYAPSFGIQEIPQKYWIKYRDMFENIDYIALREESGKKIVKEISGRVCEVVADPVLMLDSKKWKEIIPRKKEMNDRYIFCYLLGNNKWQREWIKKYAEAQRLKTVGLIHLDQRIAYDEKIYDEVMIDASPEKFLNLIRYAEVVFTDSFHCTLFSMIEQRKFWCFRRFDDGKKVSTNSRMYSILKLVGLENHMLNRNSNINIIDQHEKIDYRIIEMRINNFRKKSYEFLLSSLE